MSNLMKRIDMLRRIVTEARELSSGGSEMQEDILAVCDEIERLTAALQHYKEMYRAESKAWHVAQARVEALEAALLKYGDHDYDCEIGQSMPNSPSPCNCGFLAATEQGEEK